MTSDPNGGIIKGEWNEAAHPRDENGRFAGGGGGSSDDSEGETVTSSTGVPFYVPDPDTFMTQLTEAKNSQSDDVGWRIDDYSHTAEDYSKDKLFSAQGGSTVAVTEDGDIISLCGKYGDSVIGHELCFSGLYGFYRKSGFEPVSWCEFNKDYAPPDRKAGRRKEEPVIFRKYTGNKAAGKRAELKVEMTKFLQSTKGYSGENGYDDAVKDRDATI